MEQTTAYKQQKQNERKQNMLNIIHNTETIAQVKSISAAWNKFREVRNAGGTGTLIAENDETKEIILDIILKENTKGKIEFRDRNKEDAKAEKKTEKLTEETAAENTEGSNETPVEEA